MMQNVWTTIVRKSVGEEIIVAKVETGAALNRWKAQRIINAVRVRLPIERIALEVVVMDGEPHQQPTVYGSSPDAETFVQSMSSQLAGYRWQLAKLDC